MKQREKGQYIISEKLDNIKERRFDDEKLILIFNWEDVEVRCQT